MKNTRRFAIVILVLSLAVLACSLLTPTDATPQDQTNTMTEPSVDTMETATAPSDAVQAPSPLPKPAQPQLEIVQSQAWTDRDGNVRANVLMRNPYDFPVAPAFGAGASLLNSTGDVVKSDGLYYLDGISGGGGFVLPGETIAANACFNCEQAPLTDEEWESVKFTSYVEDATGAWEYSTEVEATIGEVSFEGDSPIFWITGTVKNNSDSVLGRISFRLFVFDQDGNLVGAGETSAWDVAPGATADISGYGIGQTPDGPVKYEVTALGVNY
jgi:hypothetical protein